MVVEVNVSVVVTVLVVINVVMLVVIIGEVVVTVAIDVIVLVMVLTGGLKYLAVIRKAIIKVNTMIKVSVFKSLNLRDIILRV